MSSGELKTLEKFRQINAEFPYNRYVKKWKGQGRKVIGWFCTYTPEEVIHAAGILPVRIWGGFKELSLDLANSYFYPTSCSTVRAAFQLAVDHKFDFLDGFVVASPCEHARRLYDVWDYWLPTKFDLSFSVPLVHGERSINWYHDELIKFKGALEESFQVKITDKALKESIKLYNRTRDILKNLSELAKLDDPPLTGAETLEVMNAVCITPKEEINPLLEELLEEAKPVKRSWGDIPRLMITGSELHNPEFIKFMEDQGCLVVLTELCSGVRYWMDNVEEKGDPLQEIARRYITRIPCHHFYPWKPRFDRIVELAKEYRVDGVINELVRYCVAWSWNRPEQKKRFTDEGFPTLDFEIMFNAGGSGQLKQRIQAFVEMLNAAKEEALV